MSGTSNAGPIVVGVDASPVSLKALKHAASLASSSGAQVIVVFSRQFPPILGEETATAVEALEESIDESEQKAKEQSTRALADAGVQWRFEVRDGDPAQELIAVANVANASLIVIGAHRHGAVSSAVFAAVAGYLLHHSDISFLVIRPDENEEGDEQQAATAAQ